MTNKKYLNVAEVSTIHNVSKRNVRRIINNIVNTQQSNLLGKDRNGYWSIHRLLLPKFKRQRIRKQKYYALNIDPCYDYKEKELDEIMEVVDDTTLLIPWPSLYETVNTRLSKNKNGIINFESLIKRPNTILLDDSAYKESALDYSMENSTKSIRPISLVDSIN